MKYAVNENVIHCRNGVSIIVNVTEMGGRQYFVIHALRGDGENIYVPVEASDSIIRPVMNGEEADTVLNKIKDIKLEFNSNTKQRRDAYKRRLGSGNVDDIAYLFRQYCLYKNNPDEVKLGPSDIDMLAYASTIFLDELALSYNQDRESVEEYIKTKLAL